MLVIEPGDRPAAPLELICPACGALIEADAMAALIARAREHTLDAHDYDIPDQHVIDAVRTGMSDHEVSLT